MSKVKVGDRVAFNYDTLDSSDKKNLLGSGTVYKVGRVENYFEDSSSVIEVSISVDRDLVTLVGRHWAIRDIADVRVVLAQQKE